MKKKVEDYDDPEAVRRLMANAKRLNNDEIWSQAFRHLCRLEGQIGNGPLEREFYETLAAYEQLLTEKNGRKTPASRTRQKLANKGLVQCLEDWAVMAEPTEGFGLLVKNGLAELTGEYLVVKHRSHFSEKAITAAQRRLEEHGIDPPSA
jgi:hypothetical protein